jgi:hypothetical protein
MVYPLDPLMHLLSDHIGSAYQKNTVLRNEKPYRPERA